MENLKFFSGQTDLVRKITSTFSKRKPIFPSCWNMSVAGRKSFWPRTGSPVPGSYRWKRKKKRSWFWKGSVGGDFFRPSPKKRWLHGNNPFSRPPCFPVSHPGDRKTFSPVARTIGRYGQYASRQRRQHFRSIRIRSTPGKPH